MRSSKLGSCVYWGVLATLHHGWKAMWDRKSCHNLSFSPGTHSHSTNPNPTITHSAHPVTQQVHLLALSLTRSRMNLGGDPQTKAPTLDREDIQVLTGLEKTWITIQPSVKRQLFQTYSRTPAAMSISPWDAWTFLGGILCKRGVREVENINNVQTKWNS